MTILRVTKEQTRWISSTEQVVLKDVLSQCRIRTMINSLSIFYGYSLVADEDDYINISSSSSPWEKVHLFRVKL